MKRRLISWGLLLVVTLAYPLAVLASGAPRFPSRAECVRPAHRNGDLETVFGRFASQDAADAVLAHVLHLGFSGSQIEPDGCGYLKVAVHGISTLAVGRGLVAEAHKAGLQATLEQVGP